MKEKFGDEAESLYIPLNDAVGSVRQTLRVRGLTRVLATARVNKFHDLIPMIRDLRTTKNRVKKATLAIKSNKKTKK